MYENINYNNVSIVMGTKNEEKAIEKVISDIKNVTSDLAEIIVVDSSSDRTPKIATMFGATVIRQEPRGYGEAVKLALMSATRNIIITTDCDGTYPMEDIPKFVKLINEGYDVVSGSRLSKKADNMPIFNKFGNWLFATMTSIFYGISVTDVTTGMRAYRKEVIHSINWTENVGLSAELLFRPALKKYKIIEISIDYRERLGETKLNPITGGIGIFKSIMKYAIIRN
jgi:glycosyltransferase involved in cell wall biosynthesis